MARTYADNKFDDGMGNVDRHTIHYTETIEDYEAGYFASAALRLKPGDPEAEYFQKGYNAGWDACLAGIEDGKRLRAAKPLMCVSDEPSTK